jgi:hypothetical protein
MIASSFCVHSQSITPEKSTIEYNGSMRPSIMVHLDPKTKSLKKSWVKFLKDEYDFKLKGAGWFRNKDVLYADEVVVKRLSSKQMDFYTRVVEDENYSEMQVFISFGYDIYVNEAEYPNEFNAMNEMLVAFLKYHLPHYYSEEMKTATKRVNTLNKEINSLRKDIDKNNRDIEEHEEDATKLIMDVDVNKEKLRSAEIKLKKTEDRMKAIKKELMKL